MLKFIFLIDLNKVVSKHLKSKGPLETQKHIPDCCYCWQLNIFWSQKIFWSQYSLFWSHILVPLRPEQENCAGLGQGCQGEIFSSIENTKIWFCEDYHHHFPEGNIEKPCEQSRWTSALWHSLAPSQDRWRFLHFSTSAHSNCCRWRNTTGWPQRCSRGCSRELLELELQSSGLPCHIFHP